VPTPTTLAPSISPNLGLFGGHRSGYDGPVFNAFRVAATLLGLLQLFAARPAAATCGGQHDFDFEFGNWTVRLRRLAHPLTNAHAWVEYVGTNVDRKVWGGRANLGELELHNSTNHIEGLSLRLYDPRTCRWNIYFANSSSVGIGIPTVGSFTNRRGTFYDDERLAGKAIRVRFTFSGITSSAFHFEQSFSPDAGKTWSVNWIADFSRVKHA
jgi:hypothetical protein